MFFKKALTEGGRILLEHGGSFRSFISQAGNDAQKMVELIVEKIPSYRDEATYEVWMHGVIAWTRHVGTHLSVVLADLNRLFFVTV